MKAYITKPRKKTKYGNHRSSTVHRVEEKMNNTKLKKLIHRPGLAKYILTLSDAYNTPKQNKQTNDHRNIKKKVPHKPPARQHVIATQPLLPPSNYGHPPAYRHHVPPPHIQPRRTFGHPTKPLPMCLRREDLCFIMARAPTVKVRAKRFCRAEWL